jgi:hypothetical protein
VVTSEDAPTACRRTVSGSFHSALAVLFTFPSRYWFTIGLSRVFSLAGWCRQIQTGFHRSRLTQDPNHLQLFYEYGAITLCGYLFQDDSSLNCSLLLVLQPQRINTSVWALPRSLATTCGIIIIFSSSSYLDVSVQRVTSITVICLQHIGLPHSDIYGSKPVCSSP